jgi:hypothetical protein
MATKSTAGTTLKKIIDEGKQQRWHQVHDLWNNYRLQCGVQLRDDFDIAYAPTDMHGSPTDMINNLIPEACMVSIYTKCDNCKNTSDKKFYTHRTLPHNLPIKEAFHQAIVIPTFSDKCTKCHQFGGVMRSQPMEVSKKNTPWFIDFEVDLNNFTVREAMQAPTKIAIPGGGMYKLAFITLHSQEDHPGGHFTSIQYINDQFVYYDGMRTDRFTKIPDRVFNKFYTVTLITYFLNE